MVEIGASLSSEEHGPRMLVKIAQMAEEAGFSYALISDHYHPWTERQGNSPFVWSVLGGIAMATKRLSVGTGVTCPIMRQHPALVAQAAATVGNMFEGRFFLGLGAGENLNEHIYGDQWPPAPARHEMLREAIQVMRELWTGDDVTHYGPNFTVEEARLFTTPDQDIPIMVAASGPDAAELAAENDGLISTTPGKDVVAAFEAAGGRGKRRYGQLSLCYDQDEARARRTAREWWPTSGLKGNVNWELKTYALFDQLAEMVTEDMVAESIICGPDPEKAHAAIGKFVDAGFTHVYLHQVGPEQEKFIKWASTELLPRYEAASRPGQLRAS